jgi:hypothetical protein
MKRILALARRDKSESNPILTWPMLALGLDCANAHTLTAIFISIASA